MKTSAAIAASSNKPFALRGDNRALIYSRAGGIVTIRIVVTASFGYLLEYSIRDKSGHIVASGDVNKKSTIEFKAAAKQEYYLDLYAKSRIYRLTVKNAVFALSGEIQNRGLHLNNQLIPLYFYIPNSVSTATVTISADGPREVAAAYVLSPTGDKIGVLDTECGPADRLTIDKNSNLPDFYQIKWKTPKAGNVDDVWVKLDKNIPSWFYVSPVEIVIHQNTKN